VIFKGKAPKCGLNNDVREYTLLLGAEGAMVERGVLPTLGYIEMGGESVLILRIEPMQLMYVPRVVDVLPCLGAA
jgi:hypothetical protein